MVADGYEARAQMSFFFSDTCLDYVTYYVFKVDITNLQVLAYLVRTLIYVSA